MLWHSSREVFWIICWGQSRILSVEWYPSTLWRLAVSYLSLMASSLRWASQNPLEVSFSLGFSPCPLQDSQGQSHDRFLCSHLLLPGFFAINVFPWDSAIPCPHAHTASQPFPIIFLNTLGCSQRQVTRDGLREAEQTETTKEHALKMWWPGG